MPAGAEEDAHLLLQNDWGPGRCSDSGSGGRPCRAHAARARLAAPGSSLQGKCRKRALTPLLLPLPPPLGSPPGTPPPLPPACGARPPLTLTRARTAPLARAHSRRLAFRPAEAQASETTRPTAAGSAGAAAPRARIRRPRRHRRAHGEQSAPPASRRGGARAPRAGTLSIWGE